MRDGGGIKFLILETIACALFGSVYFFFLLQLSCSLNSYFYFHSLFFIGLGKDCGLSCPPEH